METLISALHLLWYTEEPLEAHARLFQIRIFVNFEDQLYTRISRVFPLK